MSYTPSQNNTVSALQFMTPAQIADVTNFVGSIDVSAAIVAALGTGKTIEFTDGRYYFASPGSTYTGTGRIVGTGSRAIIAGDAAVITLTGDYSSIENVRLENQTTPFVIQRINPNLLPFSDLIGFTATTTSGSNVLTSPSTSPVGLFVIPGTPLSGAGIPTGALAGVVTATTITLVNTAGAAVNATANASGVSILGMPFIVGQACLATLVQTNADGFYQPTSNDTDIYSSLPSNVQTQDIGPTITLTGKHCRVNNITGRYAKIFMLNCQDSEVRDCKFKGGKGSTGAITYWNAAAPRGFRNRAINNDIWDSSFSSVTFMANDNGQMIGNISYGAGESGLKTWQGTGITGADYCTSMQMVGNMSLYAYYDCFDYFMDNGTPTLYAKSASTGDVAYGAFRDGFNFSGQMWSITGAKAENCGQFNILAQVANSTLSFFSRQGNVANNSATNDVAIVGVNNVLSLGRVRRETAGRAGYGLYVDGAGGLCTISNMDATDGVSTPSNFVPGSTYNRVNVMTNGANTAPGPGLPNCFVYPSGTQSLSAGVATKIAFDTAVYDTGIYFDLVNHRYLPLIAGKYEITLSIAITGTMVTGDYIQAQVLLDGSQQGSYSSVTPASTSQTTCASVTTTLVLNGSTDYVEGWVQVQAAGLSTISGGTYSFINIHRISD